MITGQMQFDWERYKRPGGGLSFGLFFRPILWRFESVWWICDHWPLCRPASEGAEIALELIENGLTPPDTILPAYADEIIGDRDEFYGVASPPESVNAFYNAHRTAVARDHDLEEQLISGAMGSNQFERSFQAYEKHVRAHGTHTVRFFESYPVEFAFMTNDTVWWFAAREDAVMAELCAYAMTIRGMSCRATMAFGY